MKTYTKGILWSIAGILFFIAFAVDIENDRDVWTWFWLLNSTLAFIYALLIFIKHKSEFK
jgi:hypothetical protein